MKNKLKKLLCTALAAVSLSAMVTVPSSLNATKSDNAIVNVMEAKALSNDFDIYEYIGNGKKHYHSKLILNYKVEPNYLPARKDPDDKSKEIYGFCAGCYVKIDKLKFVQNQHGENRIWGRTYYSYNCRDNKKRSVWVLLKRAFDEDGNGKCHKVVSNAQCQGKYGPNADVQFCSAISGYKTWRNRSWIEFTKYAVTFKRADAKIYEKK